jgi:hypothetical protein
MAELALRLPVFIASPSDVPAERDAIEKSLRELAREAAKDRLLLEPIRWEEDSRPGAGRPQSLIGKLLNRSELLIVVFGERLGSPASVDSPETGAQEELRVGLDLVRRGRADDVFLYFRRQPEAGGSKGSAVAAFREEVNRSKQVFAWDFSDSADLAALVTRHVRDWLRKWERVADICDVTLCDVSVDPIFRGETRLQRLSRIGAPAAPGSDLAVILGRAAVESYQVHGPSGAAQAFSLSSAEALRVVHALERELDPPVVGRPRQQMQFANQEWFRYFCACGLVTAILDRRHEAVEHLPYENAIHQYLSVLSQPLKRPVTDVLVQWLGGADGATASKPVVRNFAAYVLGMIGAEDAQDDLARAFEEDDGEDVRLYCCTSLGKLRCRRHLDLLVERHSRENDPAFRQALGQAICRIAGVAEFDL